MSRMATKQLLLLLCCESGQSNHLSESHTSRKRQPGDVNIFPKYGMTLKGKSYLLDQNGQTSNKVKLDTMLKDNKS